MSLLTGVYGHVGHHILHEQEKNRRRNNALADYPKEDEFLRYCPLYMKHLEDYTNTSWPRGLRTESVTEDEVLGFVFYQSHWDKREQGEISKADETRIPTRNFDTKDCSALLMRSVTGTTELFEICNRSQFLDYYQINQYLCVCLKLLKKQRYAGQSVIYTEMIKPERVCMLMNMVQSRKVKYAKST